MNNQLSQLKSLTNLTLYLTNTKIGNEGLSVLGQQLALCEKIEYLALFLSFNQINQQGAQDLCQGLAQCKQLKIIYIYLRQNEVESKGLQSMLKQLSQNKELNQLTLDLSACNIQDNYPIDIDCFQQMTNLQFLSLQLQQKQKFIQRANKIGQQWISQLAQQIHKCPRLQHLELYLGDNFINAEGFAALGKGLKKIQNLNQLEINLRGNSTEFKDLSSFIYELSQCGKLVMLDINHQLATQCLKKINSLIQIVEL